MAIGAFTGIPLATLREHQTAYLAAHLAIASGQSYTIAGRSLNRANLPEIQNTLRELNTEIQRQEGRSKPRVTYADVRST